MLELLTLFALAAPPAQPRLLGARTALSGTSARREAAPCGLNKAQRRGPGTSQRQDRDQALIPGVRSLEPGQAAEPLLSRLVVASGRAASCPSRPRDPPRSATR